MSAMRWLCTVHRSSCSNRMMRPSSLPGCSCAGCCLRKTRRAGCKARDSSRCATRRWNCSPIIQQSHPQWADGREAAFRWDDHSAAGFLAAGAGDAGRWFSRYVRYNPPSRSDRWTSATDLETNGRNGRGLEQLNLHVRVSDEVGE